MAPLLLSVLLLVAASSYPAMIAVSKWRTRRLRTLHEEHGIGRREEKLDFLLGEETVGRKIVRHAR